MFRRFTECAGKQAGVWLMAGALLVGGGYYYQVRQMQEQEQCQARYNTTFTEQARIRNEFLTRADDARDHLLTGVSQLVLAEPTKNQKVLEDRDRKFRELFITYGQEIKALNEARENTPLPAIPDC